MEDIISEFSQLKKLAQDLHVENVDDFKSGILKLADSIEKKLQQQQQKQQQQLQHQVKMQEMEAVFTPTMPNKWADTSFLTEDDKKAIQFGLWTNKMSCFRENDGEPARFHSFQIIKDKDETEEDSLCEMGTGVFTTPVPGRYRFDVKGKLKRCDHGSKAEWYLCCIHSEDDIFLGDSSFDSDDSDNKEKQAEYKAKEKLFNEKKVRHLLCTLDEDTWDVQATVGLSCDRGVRVWNEVVVLSAIHFGIFAEKLCLLTEDGGRPTRFHSFSRIEDRNETAGDRLCEMGRGVFTTPIPGRYRFDVKGLLESDGEAKAEWYLACIHRKDDTFIDDDSYDSSDSDEERQAEFKAKEKLFNDKKLQKLLFTMGDDDDEEDYGDAYRREASVGFDCDRNMRVWVEVVILQGRFARMDSLCEFHGRFVC